MPKVRLHMAGPSDGPMTGRARSGLVFPIGIVVAVAFICVIVAAVGSAHRADEVATEQETQRLIAGVRAHADRLVREVKSVSSVDQTVERTAGRPDQEPIAARVGKKLGV